MAASEKRKQWQNYINTTLIGGFLVILPVAILLIVFRSLFNLILGFISPITKILTLGGKIDGFLANILAFVIIVVVCFAVGLIVKTTVGNYLFGQFDKHILQKIPFYKPISETVKQFSNREKMPFSKVVVIDVFGTGTRMTGFITDEHTDDFITVFVPTGPNPTNGFIFHVKADQITEIDIPVEEAMKSIISVGAGSQKLMASYMKNKDV